MESNHRDDPMGHKNQKQRLQNNKSSYTCTLYTEY